MIGDAARHVDLLIAALRGRAHMAAVAVLAISASWPASAGAANRILFSRGSQRPGSDSHSRLWVMRPNGTSRHRLATPVNTGGGDFARSRPRLIWEVDPARSGPTKWFMGDRAGRHGKLVLRRAGAGGTRLSPNARRLAFADDAGLDIADLRTRRITTFRGLHGGGWAPDSRHVLVASEAQTAGCTMIPFAGSAPCPPPSYAIEDLDVVTGATRTITTVSGGDVSSPSWSPDGKRIAFAHATTDGQPFQLFVANADGSGLTQVTGLPGGVDAAVWAPDSRRLALLIGGSTPGKHYIATIKADGSGTKRLTHDEYTLALDSWG